MVSRTMGLRDPRGRSRRFLALEAQEQQAA